MYINHVKPRGYPLANTGEPTRAVPCLAKHTLSAFNQARYYSLKVF